MDARRRSGKANDLAYLESSAVITHVASLDLPRVNAECPIATIDILAGPLISCAPDKPFYQSNDRRIASFLILYARFEHSSFSAAGHIHGKWIVLPSSWSGCCMRLLDFNISHSVDPRSGDDQGHILDTAPSELQPIVDEHLPNPNPADPDSTLAFGFHLFNDPVRTSLPYREIQRVIDAGAGTYYSDDDDLGPEYVFLLDEDHVIAVDTNLAHTPKARRVGAFGYVVFVPSGMSCLCLGVRARRACGHVELVPSGPGGLSLWGLARCASGHVVRVFVCGCTTRNVFSLRAPLCPLA
ncbi:hypothetical protein C8F01DRAFT_694579 [Mycena amicta]|nr:hypothetical protein C8F01DRAFT_694579 [Mycena amicta]